MKRRKNRRVFYRVPEDSPLVGSIAFGIIDRGTNLLQVRPSTACPLSCIFCSTDAGPMSRNRQCEYFVNVEPLIETMKEIVAYKNEKTVEALIDTVGDPLVYSKLTDLVQKLREIECVKRVTIETHGLLLNEKLIEDLNDSGLTRINLSIDAVNPELAKKLAGDERYNINRVIELAKYALENTDIDIQLTPVWVPSLNDSEIPRLIDLAVKLKAGKKVPPIAIQKYESHKWGRKPPGITPISWKKFYNKLRILEKKYNVKLIMSIKDYNIKPSKMLPIPYKINEKLWVKVLGPGWLWGEVIAEPINSRKPKRIITIVGIEDVKIGEKIKVQIIKNKHNIYIAMPTY